MVTGQKGFCFDFRLTATFQTSNVALQQNSSLLHDLLVHVHLFQTTHDLSLNIVHEQVNKEMVSENGELEVGMSAVVQVKDLVTMVEAYNGAVEALTEYNTYANSYAKWVNDRYTAKLTPTPFKPIPSDVIDFAQFYDTADYQECNQVYAMSEIQSCDGVETRDFSKLPFNRVQVVLRYFIFKGKSKCKYKNTIFIIKK